MKCLLVFCAKNGLYLIIPILIFFTGCADRQIDVSEEFWENTDSKIGLVVDAQRHGRLYKCGSQGLLDMAITDALSGEGHYINTVQPYGFLKIANYFKTELELAGFQTKVYPKTIDVGDFPEISWPKKDIYKYDLSYIFEEMGCDKIIVLRLSKYGIIRYFYSFIALNEPEALVDVHGVMVEKEGNRVIWDSGKNNCYIRREVNGEWKQPPDYPNMTKALELASEESKMFMLEKFFKDRISEKSLRKWELSMAELGENNPDILKMRRLMWRMDNISALSVTCKKPYIMTRNCSDWSGPKKKINIDGIKAELASNEEGTVVLVKNQGLSDHSKNKKILISVLKIIMNHNIKINKLTGLYVTKSPHQYFGYFIEVDQDLYSILNANSENHQN